QHGLRSSEQILHVVIGSRVVDDVLTEGGSCRQKQHCERTKVQGDLLAGINNFTIVNRQVVFQSEGATREKRAHGTMSPDTFFPLFCDLITLFRAKLRDEPFPAVRKVYPALFFAAHRICGPWHDFRTDSSYTSVADGSFSYPGKATGTSSTNKPAQTSASRRRVSRPRSVQWAIACLQTKTGHRNAIQNARWFPPDASAAPHPARTHSAGQAPSRAQALSS